MIRFISDPITQVTHFNMCRDSSNQPGTKVLTSVHHKDESIEEMIKDFQNEIDSSKDGIIMNENIDIGRKNTNLAIASTQALTKVNKKGKLIGIWHAARLSNKLAAQYKNDNIDYIFLESYWPWTWNMLLWLFFKLNWYVAKKNGIISKLVYVLGVNQGHPIVDANNLWNSISWTNKESILIKQLKYLRKKCPNSAGIGLYLKTITLKYQTIVDNKMFEYFLD